MPWIIIGGGLAAVTGFKMLTSATEDLADSSLKLTGAAVMLGGLYIAAKKAKVI